MSDKPAINNIFGVPQPEPLTMLVGLTADMAATKQCIVATDTRLGNIEQNQIKTHELLAAVASIQTSVTNNAADISELKARGKDIDEALNAITAHDGRIKVLERDIIKDGQAELNNIKELLDKKEKAKEAAAAVKAAVGRERRRMLIGALITISIGVGGFTITHLLIPHLNVITTFVTSLFH